MFVRKKPNKSGLVSVQVIDKSQGKYKVLKTIGSSKDALEIERLVAEGKSYAQKQMGLQEIDFTDHRKIFTDVLSSISSHKLVGIQYVLGKIFDDVGFGQINGAFQRSCVIPFGLP
jgi:hypothetical protein